MNHRSRPVLLLAVGLTLSATAASAPPTTPQAAAGASIAASSATTGLLTPGAGAQTVAALAQRCIDARHVALVRNALLRGRIFSLAEAHGWCENRSPVSTAGSS